MSTKCRYCGSASYDSGCIHSPTRKHRHGPDNIGNRTSDDRYDNMMDVYILRPTTGAAYQNNIPWRAAGLRPRRSLALAVAMRPLGVRSR